MAKRIFSLTLSVVVFLSLASCSLTSYERRYPSYFTGEYVQDHYELVDMNLVYLESYRNCTSSVSSRNGQNCQFMKIKDVPLEQFVGMISYTSLFPCYENYILFNLDYPINPINDFEVKKIELFVKNRGLVIRSDNFDKCGELRYDEQLCEIDNLELKQEILESIRYSDRNDLYAPPLGFIGFPIAIRIHFKEYENIVWDAEIGKRDGKYYLYIILVDEEQKIFSCENGNYAYVYVGPNFDALMESLFNS